MRIRLTDIDSQYLMATRDGAGGFLDGGRNKPSPTDSSR
jgi:hypothetical protein